MDIPKEVRDPSCVFLLRHQIGENISYFENHAKFSKRFFFHSNDHTVGFPQQKLRSQLSIIV